MLQTTLGQSKIISLMFPLHVINPEFPMAKVSKKGAIQSGSVVSVVWVVSKKPNFYPSRESSKSTQAAPDKKTTGADDAEWLGLFGFLVHFGQSVSPEFFKLILSCWTEVNCGRVVCTACLNGSPGVCRIGPCRNCSFPSCFFYTSSRVYF